MEILLTIAIVLLALMCFIGEWLPVDVTALALMVSLMTLGLVTPEEGISGFSNSATMTVMAMFILSAGIARTGVIQVLSNLLINWGGKHTTRQIFTMGIILAPITAFINNTAVVAVFLPVVEEWCKKQGMSVSKLLIPLSYITILGGTITLLGTSTNVLASGLSEQLGYGAFSIFEFTQLGLITAVAGLVYLIVVAPRLLPKRRKPNSDLVGQDYQLKDYVFEMVLEACPYLINKTLSDSQLQRQFDVDVLELIRNNYHFPQPLGDKILQEGDILLVRGSCEELFKVKRERCVNILPEVELSDRSLEATLTTDEEGIMEVLILSNSHLVGFTLKELHFRQRYNATVLAIRRGEELIRTRLSNVPLRFGDILLLQGPKQSLIGMQMHRGLLAIEQKEIAPIRPEKAIIAISIGLGVVLLAAFNVFPIVVSALIGVVLMVITGCLKPAELYQAVRWDIIFLLASLIPLGIAMKNSGTTHLLADNLVLLGTYIPAYWLLTFFFVITALTTEVLSNSAAVVLLLPIAAEVADMLQLNPFAFILAVTFAASNSFMTPLGYQTNTMVYGAGGYKFTDFLRVGAPLTLLMSLIVPPLIIRLYGL
ncbi:conserved membrane hypothetical protein [Hyella patelloides LEGE 07179]|uniref:RCK C-terminal domain-containing protein n=1 Tax=Hyella patelloides LEGE 07179 TaxID=945734 RepID=A0A563VQ03_9CYAN|nr:SLC13 family permease [Hyella patelloides]VEP13546.1 conserved membrane hypothetical protein [Hyella patelloides LEGE 07179]